MSLQFAFYRGGNTRVNLFVSEMSDRDFTHKRHSSIIDTFDTLGETTSWHLLHSDKFTAKFNNVMGYVSTAKLGRVDRPQLVIEVDRMK